MTIETAAVREVAKLTQNVLTDTVKKAWSILDAATEKMRPGEVLSQQAIQAVQGKIKPGG